MIDCEVPGPYHRLPSEVEMVEGEGGRRRRRVVFDSESGSEGDVESEGEEELEGWSLLAGTKQKARGNGTRRRREEELRREEDSSEGEEEEEGVSGRGYLDDEAEEGESEDVMESESESEEEEEDEEQSFILDEAVERRGTKRKIAELSTEEESEGSEEGEMEGDGGEVEEGEGAKQAKEGAIPGHLRWKEGLVEKAKEAFDRRRQGNASLRKLIYSDTPLVDPPHEEEESGDELGGLFHVTKKRSVSAHHHEDHSLPVPSLTLDWSDPQVAGAVKSLFVTGSWGAEDAQTLLEEEEEMFGDFEDLETGETRMPEPGQSARMVWPLLIPLPTNDAPKRHDLSISHKNLSGGFNTRRYTSVHGFCFF